jgi:hypothetical protein
MSFLHVFPQSLQENGRIVLRLGHDHFLLRKEGLPYFRVLKGKYEEDVEF